MALRSSLEMQRGDGRRSREVKFSSIRLRSSICSRVISLVGPSNRLVFSRKNWDRASAGAPGILPRISRVKDAVLQRQEVDVFGSSGCGDFEKRENQLVERILTEMESKWNLPNATEKVALDRIRALRVPMIAALSNIKTDDESKTDVRRDLKAVGDARHHLSFPNDYLADEREVTDTRVLETIEDIEEGVFGESSWPGPLHAVIDVGEAIEVPAKKAPKGQTDPLLSELGDELKQMLAQLSKEASPFPADRSKS